jgi:hypothetical protein
MADPKESGSKRVGQGAEEKAEEKREGASEQSSEKKGLPEHRDMSVRRDLGEGDIDNPGERLGTPNVYQP